MKFWGQKTALDFQNEMNGTTSILGRDSQIEVTFSGEKAFVQGNQVNFPSMDPNAELTYSQLAAFRGWVDHEAATIRYADRKYMNELKDEQKEKPFLHELFQTIEGIRCEQFYTDIYAGAGKNLGNLAEKVFEHQKLNRDLDDDNKLSFVPAALGILGRQDYDGFYCWFEKSSISTIVDDADFEKKIYGWADEISTLSSTQDSYNLAKRIIEESGQENPDQDNKSKNKDGEGEGDEGSQPKSAQPSKMEEIVINEQIKKIEMNNSYQYGEEVPYRIFTTKFDRVHHWKDANINYDNINSPSIIHSYINGGETMRKCYDLNKYKKTVMSMGAHINITRRRLELLIQAKRRLEWDRMKDMGRLDSGRLVAAYKGDENVFKRRDDATDLDTAVTVLVDLSGSMKGNKRKTAYETAVMLSECLNKIGVPFEVIGFDEQAAFPTEYKKNYYKMGQAAQSRYTRCAPIFLWVFKSFKDKLFDARGYLSGLDNNLHGLAGSGNVDGESVALAANRLLARPEKRKIMFVLSDGEPTGCGCSHASNARHLKETVERLSKKIDMVGIGIEDESVRHYYPKWVVCDRAEDLTTTMLDVLKNALLPEKKKARKAA